jgi:gp16 family phage-associated protein
MANTTTPKAIREGLSRLGKTHADLAAEIGVKPSIVRGLLYGTLKGRTGEAHKAAVLLGLKDGVIVKDGMSVTEAMKAAAA